MSIRFDSKKIFLEGFYLLGTQHEDPHSTAGKYIWYFFSAQRVNGKEPFVLNTFLLSVLPHYFIRPLPSVTLSINSTFKQNTSPPPIN
jgi:hypothetical protein